MDYQYASSSKKDENSCCGGSAWFVKDICGIICACLTWLLILYAEFVVLFVILLPSSRLFYRYLNTIVFQTFTIFAFISHLRTMFTDPGAVPKGNACNDTFTPDGVRNGQIFFKCPKCCSFKPERAHHCSVCQRCIRKMDHHCPWVNNCVGENNQKYFILFTFYITIISSHALFLSVNQFITCIHSDWRECSVFSPPATIIMILFLVFEALLFAIFTLVMFITQLQAIWIDETGIEQLKKEEARWTKTSRWKSLQTVFVCSLVPIAEILARPQDPPSEDSTNMQDITQPNTKSFEAFYPRNAYGIPNGSARPAHGHGSFYQFRNPALVDTKNSPAFGYRFDGGRRFNFE